MRGDVDACAWDAIVDGAGEGWLWHRHAFQDVLTTWPSREDASFALVLDEDLVATVPAHLVRGGPRGSARRLDILGGPCIRHDLSPKDRRLVGNETVRAMIDLARSSHALHVTVTLPPLAPALRPPSGPRVNPLRSLGFEDRSSQTWMVDLTADEETIYAGIQKGTRSQIRAAQREGVSVRSGRGPEDVAAYVRLHRETYERSGARPHPAAYFEAIGATLVPAGLAELLVAELDGVAVAAAFIATDKGGTAYWTGANSVDARRLFAGDLLQWEAIRRARTLGCELYDCGEADFGDGKARAISDFKRKFGGTLQPIFRARRYTTARPISAVLRVIDAQPLRRTAGEDDR